MRCCVLGVCFGLLLGRRAESAPIRWPAVQIAYGHAATHRSVPRAGHLRHAAAWQVGVQLTWPLRPPMRGAYGPVDLLDAAAEHGLRGDAIDPGVWWHELARPTQGRPPTLRDPTSAGRATRARDGIEQARRRELARLRTVHAREVLHW